MNAELWVILIILLIWVVIMFFGVGGVSILKAWRKKRIEKKNIEEDYLANLTNCKFCGSELPQKGAKKCPECMEWQR